MQPGQWTAACTECGDRRNVEYLVRAVYSPDDDSPSFTYGVYCLLCWLQLPPLLRTEYKKYFLVSHPY
jgi:hypothetical protein